MVRKARSYFPFRRKKGRKPPLWKNFREKYQKKGRPSGESPEEVEDSSHPAVSDFATGGGGAAGESSGPGVEGEPNESRERAEAGSFAGEDSASSGESGRQPEGPGYEQETGEEKEAGDFFKGVRKVEDVMERVRRRAMTVKQLRQTIESTVEARVAGLKKSLEGIEQVVRRGSAEGGKKGISEAEAEVVRKAENIEQVLKTTFGELSDKFDQLKRSAGEVRSEREAFAGEVKSSVEDIAARLEEVKGLISEREGEREKLEGELGRLEERLAAWLERINVGLFESREQESKAEKQREELLDSLKRIKKERLDREGLSRRLDSARENLSQGVRGIRKEVSGSLLGRTFFGDRIESILARLERSREEIDGLLKDL